MIPSLFFGAVSTEQPTMIAYRYDTSIKVRFVKKRPRYYGPREKPATVAEIDTQAL